MFARRVIDVRSEDLGQLSVSTSSLFDRVPKQVRPLDISGQPQIVRQSERILGRCDRKPRPTSNFLHGSKQTSFMIEVRLALINYSRRANAALCEN
jgi:hypothetical protein